MISGWWGCFCLSHSDTYRRILSHLTHFGSLAWEVNPDAVRVMAVYPLTGCPSAVQFLEMVYNAVVRGGLKRVAVAQKVAQIIC